MPKTLHSILEEYRILNRDKKIIFPDIDDQRVFDALSELLKNGDTPVICGNASQKERYDTLIDQWLTYFEVPEGEKNEVFAAQKLASWEVDGFLWGNTSSSSDIARALIKNLWTAPGISRASSYFLFGKDDQEVFLYADCWFQIDPSPEELAEITLLTVQNALKYGIKPRVAMLSFSTAWSGGSHPKVIKVREATQKAKELLREKGLGDVLIEWEIQFDAAIIPEIWYTKNPQTTLREPANVFIFPDLDAGNIAYKITQRLAWYTALWPILQWFAAPANDLSRGCSVEDIVQMYHITKNSL